MSTSVSKFALVAFFAFAFLCCSVSAWGRDGHEITGAIADEFLSPKGKAFVDKILDAYEGPDGEDFDNLKELAPFADALRQTYDWAKNFHFINIPSDNEQVRIKHSNHYSSNQHATALKTFVCTVLLTTTPQP
jgi:hypothetical protein